MNSKCISNEYVLRFLLLPCPCVLHHIVLVLTFAPWSVESFLKLSVIASAPIYIGIIVILPLHFGKTSLIVFHEVAQHHFAVFPSLVQCILSTLSF